MPQPEAPEEHFTATIEVTKTIGPQQPKNSRGFDEGVKKERKVTEVARIVVRSESLETLKTKINGHVDLIDDI